MKVLQHHKIWVNAAFILSFQYYNHENSTQIRLSAVRVV